MSKPSLLPYAAFAACGIIWGSTFLAIRIGNDSLPPLWACTLRLTFAALLLNGIALATRKGWPKGEALKPALLYGFFEFAVSLPLLYWGEKYAPSGLAAMIYAVCPVIAMLEARALGQERLNAKKLAAAFLAFIGVGVIFWKELDNGQSSGALFAIFVAACAGPLSGLLLQRGPKQDTISLNAISVTLGIPFCLTASIALGEGHVLPVTAKEIFPVVYLTLMGSLGAFLIFSWLLNHWRTTTVSFLGVVVPVIAVIVGAVFAGEKLAPGSPIGAAIVIVGVVFVLRAEAVEKSKAALAEA